MKSTAIGTLDIKNDNSKKEITGTLILLSVKLQNQRIKKYYMSVVRDAHTESNDVEEENHISDNDNDNDSDNEEDISDDSEGSDEDSDQEDQQVVEISSIAFEHLRRQSSVRMQQLFNSI